MSWCHAITLYISFIKTLLQIQIFQVTITFLHSINDIQLFYAVHVFVFFKTLFYLKNIFLKIHCEILFFMTMLTKSSQIIEILKSIGRKGTRGPKLKHLFKLRMLKYKHVKVRQTVQILSIKCKLKNRVMLLQSVRVFMYSKIMFQMSLYCTTNIASKYT